MCSRYKSWLGHHSLQKQHYWDPGVGVAVLDGREHTGCRHCWASTLLGGGLPCSHLPTLFPTLEGWAGLWGANRVVSGRTVLLPEARCWLLALHPPISRRPCTQMFSSAFCVEDTGSGVCPRSSSLEPGGSTVVSLLYPRRLWLPPLLATPVPGGWGKSL